MTANVFNTPSKNPITQSQYSLGLISNTIVEKKKVNGVEVTVLRVLDEAMEALESEVDKVMGKSNVIVATSQADIDGFVPSNKQSDTPEGDNSQSFTTKIAYTVLDVGAFANGSTVYITALPWAGKLSNNRGQLTSLIIKNSNTAGANHNVNIAFALDTIGNDITASVAITGLESIDGSNIMLVGGEDIQLTSITATGSGTQDGNTAYAIVGNSDVR